MTKKATHPPTTPPGWTVATEVTLPGHRITLRPGVEFSAYVGGRTLRLKFRRQVTNAAGRVWLDGFDGRQVRSISLAALRKVHRTHKLGQALAAAAAVLLVAVAISVPADRAEAGGNRRPPTSSSVPDSSVPEETTTTEAPTTTVEETTTTTEAPTTTVEMVDPPTPMPGPTEPPTTWPAPPPATIAWQACPDGSYVLVVEGCPTWPAPPPVTMAWEVCPDGSYVLVAEGCAATGEPPVPTNLGEPIIEPVGELPATGASSVILTWAAAITALGILTYGVSRRRRS